MPYDQDLAERISSVLADLELGEGEAWDCKKMFGGLCFTLAGKMLIGIGKGELMIRLNPPEFALELEAGRVKLMDFAGRPLKGFAYVEPHATDQTPSFSIGLNQALSSSEANQ